MRAPRSSSIGPARARISGCDGGVAARPGAGALVSMLITPTTPVGRTSGIASSETVARETCDEVGVDGDVEARAAPRRCGPRGRSRPRRAAGRPGSSRSRARRPTRAGRARARRRRRLTPPSAVVESPERGVERVRRRSPPRRQRRARPRRRARTAAGRSAPLPERRGKGFHALRDRHPAASFLNA